MRSVRSANHVAIDIDLHKFTRRRLCLELSIYPDGKFCPNGNREISTLDRVVDTGAVVIVTQTARIIFGQRTSPINRGHNGAVQLLR